MTVSKSVLVELEEQRCLIEQQHVTIGRQQRRIELQLRLMTEMQAQIDRIQSSLQRAVVPRGAAQRPWNQPPRSDSTRSQQRFPAAIDREPGRSQIASADEQMYKGGGRQSGRRQDRSQANDVRRT